MIPLLRMYEHCEAYALWHFAVDQGWIAPTGNVLLHVDHHDDLDFGAYHHNFDEPITNAAQAQAFAQEALGIADFIVPAFWDGLFDEMVNFKSIFPAPDKPETRVVFHPRPNHLNFRPMLPLTDAERIENHDPRYRVITYHAVSLAPVALPDKPIVLDVDLDYFCWDHSLSTGAPARIEITQEAYEAFCSDPLHPLRITARRILYAEQSGGRFFVVLREPNAPSRETRDELILRRLDHFAAWLREQHITPAVIDICRSSLSGYCPANRVEWIEQELLHRLAELYGTLDDQTR